MAFPCNDSYVWRPTTIPARPIVKPTKCINYCMKPITKAHTAKCLFSYKRNFDHETTLSMPASIIKLQSLPNDRSHSDKSGRIIHNRASSSFYTPTNLQNYIFRHNLVLPVVIQCLLIFILIFSCYCCVLFCVSLVLSNFVWFEENVTN